MKINHIITENSKKPGLWANIHAKRKRIKGGSGERMRTPGSKGAPSDADLKSSRTDENDADKKRLGPDENDPWEQGWQAAHRRQDETECPYERGSKEHAQWMSGYDEGCAQPDHYNESVEKSERLSRLKASKAQGKSIGQAYSDLKDIKGDTGNSSEREAKLKAARAQGKSIGQAYSSLGSTKGVAEAKRKRPLPKFTLYPSYHAWRQELMHRGDDNIDHLDNDYVDNYRVLFAVDKNRRVVGMYYHTADIGTFVPPGHGFSDMIYYASTDPNWPYDGDDGKEDLHETSEKQYNVSAWRTDQTGTPDVEEFSIGGKTQAKSLAQELKADGFAVIKIHPAGSHYKDGQLIKSVAEGILGDIGNEIGHGIKGLKRKIQGKPSRQDVKDKYLDRAVGARQSGNDSEADKNADRWKKVIDKTNSGMMEEQDVAEAEETSNKVYFKVINTLGTGMPRGYHRVKTMRPLEDGGFYIELSTPGYGMDYTKHNYKNFSLKLGSASGRPITGQQAYNIINSKQGVAEGEEQGTIAALKGWKQWNVLILNNFYNGKYPDYSARLYGVVASSPEEARQVVLDNADYVLKDLLTRKTPNGKRWLPRNSALPIEDKRVGRANQAKLGSLTTLGFKTMLTPDGPKSMKFSNGQIVDIQREESAVTEGGKSPSPGWMLRQDPALAKKVKDAKAGYKDLKKYAGKDIPKKEVKEQNWSHDPWRDKYFGPTAGAIKKIFKITVQDGESNLKAFNVKAETEQQAREIIEKHAPDSTVMKIKFVKNLMSENKR